MVDFVWKELSEDDSIFKQGFVLSSPGSMAALKPKKMFSSVDKDGRTGNPNQAFGKTKKRISSG